MSSMSGSEIARLVLGYLQGQEMDKVALDYCKSSPYLREEYSILKRGMKIKQVNKPRTLIEIIKEYIEIEEIVTEYFDKELDQHEEIPNDMLRVQTLKDKIKYACSAWLPEDASGHARNNIKRKRSAVATTESDEDSDETMRSSPRATLPQDLPGYVRPTLKRRKLYDSSLVINGFSEKDVHGKENAMQRQPILGSDLAEMMLSEPNAPNMLAQSINNALANNARVHELSNKMGDVTDQLDELMKGFYDFEEPLNTSSGTSKTQSDPECDVIASNSRQLNTPTPNDGNTSGRYDLRPNRHSSSGLNTSRKKKTPKVCIISDVKIDPLQTQSNEIVISDSESYNQVSTTYQPQVLEMNQPCQAFYDPKSQPIFLPLQLPNSTTIPIVDQQELNLFTHQSANQILSIILADPNQQGLVDTMNDQNLRFICVNKSEVNMEGSQPMQILASQPDTAKGSEKKQEETALNEKPKENADILTQFEQMEQKPSTPNQMIKSSIPSTSRSLSTPRHGRQHVRVLDFNNTPNRFQLAGILEGKHELSSNTPKFPDGTPHNRSIASSLPSSAPPKINSVLPNEKKAEGKFIEAEAFIDENTNISGDGETPKVRKRNRKSVVRTISAHKQTNQVENDKRLKRVAVTKKKISTEDGDSNGSQSNNQPAEAKSTEDALAEWLKIRSASNNQQLFEQNLREQNSKKQESEIPTGRKRRSRRGAKKPAPKKKQAAKKAANESIKSVDLSMNSTLDLDSQNCTVTNLEAQLLEENLRSAKKVTPVKQIIHKSAKKKTPLGKLQIKLMPSPKNKLKKLKSAKKEASSQASSEAKEQNNATSTSAMNNTVEVTSAEVKSCADVKSTTPVTEKSKDDLEVAQNLISMQEVILKQANERSNQTAGAAPTLQLSAIKCVVVERNDIELLRAQNPALSMSALLETPFKGDLNMFPRTPGFNALLPPNLATPLLQPSESVMDQSYMKSHLFPTPLYPNTPGSKFTPYKGDLNSPHLMVYGAMNRPTDYSSSSSYYHPDESDGIDKQIQASIHSGQKKNEADEMETSGKVEDVSQQSLNSSTSSSSSSDSSDSDSDSDTSSSDSSDSDTSKISHNVTMENVEDVPNAENEEEVEKINAVPASESEPAMATEPERTNPIVDEDSTQIIKSHLESAEAKITKTILLVEPQAPVVNKEAEQIALLAEKRRRMQESLRQVEMKNHEKVRHRPTKKYRTITEAKRDRLRAPPVVISPSKRKSTQPKKVVSLESCQIYSDGVNVEEGDHVTAVKAQTELLITEAAGDNAIADASDVHAKQIPQRAPAIEDETVEAIEKHINKSGELVAEITKEKSASANVENSRKKLVAMLSQRKRKSDENKPKMKTAAIIDALPIARTTRSRAKAQITIRPVRNIIAKPSTSTAKSTASPSRLAPTPNDAKDADKSPVETKEKSKTKETVSKAAKLKSSTPKTKVDATKEESAPIMASNEALNKLEDNFATPAKERRSRQMKEIFGDCTDIETPIKSPPKVIAKAKQQEESNVTEAIQDEKSNKVTESLPSKEPEPQYNKCEADSSSADLDDEEEDDSDEESYEMIFSIDESDKKRFISIRENPLVKAEAVAIPVSIGRKNVFCGNSKIILAPSDEMELYVQDMESVVEMKMKQRQSNQKPKETKHNEPSSSTEEVYGQPLQTSTPSPSKTVLPKFNIKHKAAATASPKSAKKQTPTKGDHMFNGLQIDDVLVQLHPMT